MVELVDKAPDSALTLSWAGILVLLISSGFKSLESQRRFKLLHRSMDLNDKALREWAEAAKRVHPELPSVPTLYNTERNDKEVEI
jgi:hypothetical protein